MPSYPTIIAHRGLHATHPENSLSALGAAWSVGFACESDVRLTADLTPILMHDDTFERTSTATGLVLDKTCAALATARLRGEKTRLATTEPIPTLADVMLRKPRGGKLLIEIKPVDHGATVRHVLPLVDPADCVIQSFDEENLEHVRRLAPDFPVAWLIETVHSPLEVLNRPWPAVHCHHPLVTDQTIVDRIHAGGKTVGVWTVNSEADLRRCIALGVDTIITDEPALARRLID
jgi:glycerophosphoryl diester phosphodiesterase